MVQAAAIGALPLVGSAISGLGGMLSNQSRRTVERQPMPSSSSMVATAKDKKAARLISREADKERIYALLTQPEVIGFIMAIGGLIASNNIPFSSEAAKNAYLQGLASTMSVLMGLGYAGVGDLTTMIMAAAAGGGSLLTNLGEVLGEITPPSVLAPKEFVQLW